MSEKKLRLVESFVAAVRRRLNLQRFCHAVLWTAALSAAVMVLVALVYVLRGFAVPPLGYLIVGGAGLLIAVAVWMASRAGHDQAAKFSDNFFRLQDSVVSARQFARSGKEGGFYELQARQTEDRLADLQPSAIKYRVPRRVFACTLMLGVVAALLGFKAPSQAVQDRIALERRTLEETQQINQQFEELIRELQQETKGTDEEELIEPDKLQRWVDELESTKNRKEALRQYARLEQKLKEASSRLDQKRNEQLLDRAAEELQKDRETKKLAEKLTQKKYDEAAEELRELRPEKEGLTEQQKELARLKSAALRMANAARSLQRDTKTENKRQLARLGRENKSKELSGKNSRSASSGSSGSGSPSEGGDLDDAIQELEEAVGEWEELLDAAELEEAELGECKEATREEGEACKLCVGDKLNKLGDKLARMALKRRAQRRLNKLCRACSQCQSGICNNPGGKKAGWGSSNAEREERDELIDNGQFTQLEGTKGQGPSLTTVEAAEDGDGVSTRRNVARARTFRRQVESFVQREDVPENVKAGVKEYFKNIHQVEGSVPAETGQSSGQ